jgi:stage V sporulation protein AD
MKSEKRAGRRTVVFNAPPTIAGFAAVVGKKEGEGPLGGCFDKISEDAYFGQKSWEKAESAMLQLCFNLACDKAKTPPSDLDFILSGDLLNQCTGSTFAMRDTSVPFIGLYGACSTMAESLAVGSMLIDGGYAATLCAATSSHFCSAERQFRLPLSYGGQRTPTAQWTVTGSGAVILKSGGSGAKVTGATVGQITDAGVTDANNMGAAMAPAAYETLSAHFEDTGRAPDYYDLIVTGDLGTVGSAILRDLFSMDGIELGERYNDCGVLIFSHDKQDTHAGGSGCGCSASVLCGHILPAMLRGEYKRVLFAATGALMSPTTTMQGESIPGISHAVAIEMG